MRGHKWELFVLDLSFLGWMLLSALFAPVSIWLDPYRAITNANYYNRLVGAQGGPRIYEGSFTDIPNDPQSDGFIRLSPACRVQAGCLALTSRGCAV